MFVEGQITITAELSGTLTGPLQEVNRAELYGLYMYLKFASPYDTRYIYYSDSSFVVLGWRKCRHAMCSGWAVYADIWRAIYELVDDRGVDNIDVFKVKAHKSIRKSSDMYDSLKILSNANADGLAKAGSSRHPVNEKLYSQIKELKGLVVASAKYIARCLCSHFDKFPQEILGKLPPAPGPPQIWVTCLGQNICSKSWKGGRIDVSGAWLLRPLVAFSPSVSSMLLCLGTGFGSMATLTTVFFVAPTLGVGWVSLANSALVIPTRSI